jgi:hypothetical protein
MARQAAEADGNYPEGKKDRNPRRLTDGTVNCLEAVSPFMRPDQAM